MSRVGYLGKLVPFVVPWQVSPTTSFLCLQIGENTVDNPASVVFTGYFGLSDHASCKIVIHKDAEVVPYSKASESGAIDNNPYRTVTITFTLALWSRMTPSFSDHEVIEEDAYDWTAMPDRSIPAGGTSEWLTNFWRAWRDTGICPDPRAYEIQQSEWLESVGASDGYKHFLILGVDAYVEIVAKDFAWHQTDQSM